MYDQKYPLQRPEQDRQNEDEVRCWGGEGEVRVWEGLTYLLCDGDQWCYLVHFYRNRKEIFVIFHDF